MGRPESRPESRFPATPARARTLRDAPRPRVTARGDGDIAVGRNAAADASRALRLLNSPDLRQHPAPQPQERRPTTTTPAVPLNLGLVDYLYNHVDEVITHARAIAPDQLGPLPEHVEDVYEWYVDSTTTADDDQRAYRDTLIERHRLEHAVRLGEYGEVSKEPCPRCGCWGLMWDPAGQRAQCTNRRCRTPGGITSTWSLARLAAQKIGRTEIWRRNAT